MLVALLIAQALHSAGDAGAPWPSWVDLPRAAAMGGAHSAIATSNDALFVNPAGMAQSHRYHFEVDGLLAPDFPGQRVTASVVDTTSAPVASGLYFDRIAAGQPDGRGEGWQLGMGYAGQVANGVFAGGVTKFIRVHTPDGLVAKWAQDVGLLVRRGSVGWSAVMKNLSVNNDLGPLFPRQGVLGMAIGNDSDFHLAFDYKADLSDTANIRHDLAAGGEVLIDQTLALRGGGTWHLATHEFWLSLGAALVIEKASLQVAWRREMRGGPGDTGSVFEAGLTFFLE